MDITGREGRDPAVAKDLARVERWWFYFGSIQTDPWVFWNKSRGPTRKVDPSLCIPRQLSCVS